jgi:tripartite-type tricarboxylate transporter receptor subunit TctC
MQKGNRMVRLVAAAALLLAVVSAAAQSYPDRPINVIVAIAAGSSGDVLGRGAAEGMSERLKQPLVIINREGGSFTIGTAQAARARPDGYTILFTPTGALSMQPRLNKSVPYKADAMIPVCRTYVGVFVMAVRPASPFKSVADVVAAAKAGDGKVSYGLSGVNTVQHLGMIQFENEARVKLLHIPYRGESLAVPAHIAGDIDLLVISPGLAKAQGFRILGQFNAERAPTLADVPTFTELGYPAIANSEGGFFAPKGTDPAIVAQLEAACRHGVASDAHVRVTQTTGIATGFLTGAEYERQILAEDRRTADMLARGLIKTTE